MTIVRQQAARIGVALATEAFERIGLLFREQPIHDYGIDAHVEVMEGERPTGSLIAVQIKSGASYFSERSDGGFIFRTDDGHMTYWMEHSLPVVLVLCDLDTKVAYWQIVSRDTVASTGAGWRLIVPESQTIDESSAEKFKQIATRVIPSYRYTVLKQEDVSWGGAKRYSLEVLLNGTLTKAEIASVIRQVVLEHIGSRYYRDALVERHWGASDAHVIFLFVYLTLDDRKTANWICRSLWIDEDLPDDQAPSRFEGEDVGSSIVTEWSNSYRELADIYRQATLKKEDYLRIVKSIIGELKPVVSRIIDSIDRRGASGSRLELGVSHEDVLRTSEPRVTQLYMDATQMGFPPVECRDVKLKFQNVVAAAHNLVLPFFGPAATGQVNRYLEQLAVEDYKVNLTHLEYELGKVR